MMRVESTVSSSNLGAELQIGFFNRLGDNLVLGSDDSNSDGIRLSLDGHGLFHIVVSFLLAIETGDFVIGHAVSLLRSCWHCLQEAYHSLITLRVKLAVVSSFDFNEFGCSVILWVFRNIAFDVVLEISKESKAVL